MRRQQTEEKQHLRRTRRLRRSFFTLPSGSPDPIRSCDFRHCLIRSRELHFRIKPLLVSRQSRTMFIPSTWNASTCLAQPDGQHSGPGRTHVRAATGGLRPRQVPCGRPRPGTRRGTATLANRREM